MANSGAASRDRAVRGLARILQNRPDRPRIEGMNRTRIDRDKIQGFSPGDPEGERQARIWARWQRRFLPSGWKPQLVRFPATALEVTGWPQMVQAAAAFRASKRA